MMRNIAARRIDIKFSGVWDRRFSSYLRNERKIRVSFRRDWRMKRGEGGIGMADIKRTLRKGQLPPQEALMEAEAAARAGTITYDADCPPTSAWEFARIDRILAAHDTSATPTIRAI
jgi:hypothetical protein